MHITILLTLSIPLGKQSFQYLSGETRTYTLNHQGRNHPRGLFFNILIIKGKNVHLLLSSIPQLIGNFSFHLWGNFHDLLLCRSVTYHYLFFSVLLSALISFDLFLEMFLFFNNLLRALVGIRISCWSLRSMSLRTFIC